jgi:hypothetical protein
MANLDFLQSSLWGSVRGVSVEVLVFPLEVIKIQQQCSPNKETSIQIARRIFQSDGLGVFYRGLSPQLAKTAVKQIWIWPMITGGPSICKSHGVGEIGQQVLTGLSISAVDALITTPLERAKIVSALTGKAPLSFAHVYKNGWQGCRAYFAKRSVNMVTFLTAQKYLRGSEHRSFGELVIIGTQVAFIVSFMGAPFDFGNTLKQAKNQDLFSFALKNGVKKIYRGSPLNALSLTIHNIASVILIEKLAS